MSVTVLRGRVADANDFRRTAPEVMDASGAAQYLGVSERYLQENASRLEIPFREIGRTRLFSRKRLIEWIEGVGAVSSVGSVETDIE